LHRERAIFPGAALIDGEAMIVMGVAVPHAQKRVALVIGNSAYKHAGDLTNRKNDAADMAAALRKFRFQVVDGLISTRFLSIGSFGSSGLPSQMPTQGCSSMRAMGFRWGARIIWCLSMAKRRPPTRLISRWCASISCSGPWNVPSRRTSCFSMHAATIR
jgi:hypothetical protein